MENSQNVTNNGPSQARLILQARKTPDRLPLLIPTEDQMKANGQKVLDALNAKGYSKSDIANLLLWADEESFQEFNMLAELGEVEGAVAIIDELKQQPMGYEQVRLLQGHAYDWDYAQDKAQKEGKTLDKYWRRCLGMNPNGVRSRKEEGSIMLSIFESIQDDQQAVGYWFIQKELMAERLLTEEDAMAEKGMVPLGRKTTIALGMFLISKYQGSEEDYAKIHKEQADKAYVDLLQKAMIKAGRISEDDYQNENGDIWGNKTIHGLIYWMLEDPEGLKQVLSEIKAEMMQ
jgi:hypothetical protein